MNIDSKTEGSSDTANIVKSLELTIAQLNMTMQDSMDSVDVVLSSVEGIAECLTEIDAEVSRLKRIGKEIGAADSAIRKANELISTVVVALQYHDRLSQRTSHVEENLLAVSELIQKPEIQHPALWDELQEKLKVLYSTEQEQGLLAAVNGTNGTCRAVTPELDVRRNFQSSGTYGETELF